MVVLSMLHSLLAACSPGQVFLGTPPVARGGLTAPVELDCVRAGAHVFAEKPVSLSAPADVAQYTQQLMAAAAPDAQSDGCERVISVGYMFRHCAAMAKARELIETDANGRVMAVLARYNSACTWRPSWVVVVVDRACVASSSNLASLGSGVLAAMWLTWNLRACGAQMLPLTTLSGGMHASLEDRLWSRYCARPCHHPIATSHKSLWHAWLWHGWE